MTDRERLRAELDALVAAHPIPLAVVVWLNEWLTHESDEDLAGWAMRSSYTNSVAIRRSATRGDVLVEDTALVGSTGTLTFVRRLMAHWTTWHFGVRVRPGGQTETFGHSLDEIPARAW